MVLDSEVKILPTDRVAGSPKPKHALRNILAAGAVLLLLVILAFAFRSQILTGIADYLIVSDKLAKSIPGHSEPANCTNRGWLP
jgi:hypothetical protein